jgi:hypothetical protein
MFSASGGAGRILQFMIPDYTSPPLPDAIAATPEEYRDDDVIDMMRELDMNGNCTATNCHIPFEPDTSTNNKGVVLYGGALVDPRSYSVLAEPLTQYGLTVVVPVFAADVAFVGCGSGRLEFAQTAYPDIEEWYLVGHSLGGTAAMTDAWIALTQEEDPTVAGVVLLASYASPFICGPTTFVDFSMTDLPMGDITATNDGILNYTNWEDSQPYLSNNTIFVSIEGGNHGQFGSYNDTLRTSILGQVDGVATISPEEQWDITIDTILAVAGIEPPDVESPTTAPTIMSSSGVAAVPWWSSQVLLTSCLVCLHLFRR